MTQTASRPPSYLQPLPKAAPTFSSSSLAAIGATATPQLSGSSSPTRQVSPTRPAGPYDTSDKATAALVRRVLCPNAHTSTAESISIAEHLPPLTSSNDVDLQLYAIVAIVVKECVYRWYGKITPDQNFIEEVVKILAHCTRALETRFRNVDLESLVLNEIPELFEDHIKGLRRTLQLITGNEG